METAVPLRGEEEVIVLHRLMKLVAGCGRGSLVDHLARYSRTLIPVVFVFLGSFIHELLSLLDRCL